MKKTMTLATTVAAVLFAGSIAFAGDSCTTIKDGILEYSAGHFLEGELLRTGFDQYGYNYQARKSLGSYANVYLGRDGLPGYEGDDETYLADNPDAETHWAWPYRNDALIMKWNEAWLDNKDCDGDGKLDRHYGHDSYIGSGAWLTNHISGTYVNEVTSEECDWSEFYKIVAAPADAYVDSGYWYTADGTEIGEVIWGSFAIIQYVAKDTCDGIHGAQYISPAGPGLGQF